MKTLGIYLRTCGELGKFMEPEQDQEFLQRQQEKGIKLAEAEGFDYEIFQDLRSGFAVDRAGWETLLRKVATRNVGAVWVPSLDRLPDPSDVLVVLKTMRWSKCRLWINSEEHDIFDLKTERLLSNPNRSM